MGVDNGSTEMVSQVLHAAVAKKKTFSTEIREMAFKEVWTVRNKEEVDVDEMLLSMMDDEEEDQDSESKYPKLAKPNEQFFSPLLLSILRSPDSVQFGQEFVHRIKFLFDDDHIFIELLNSHDIFKNYIKTSRSNPAEICDKNSIFCNKTTIMSHILENLSVANST